MRETIKTDARMFRDVTIEISTSDGTGNVSRVEAHLIRPAAAKLVCDAVCNGVRCRYVRVRPRQIKRTK